MYPFVRQQSDGTISAGSRRANENHGLSLIAQWTGSDRRKRRAREKHLPADMRLDANCAYGARDKLVGSCGMLRRRFCARPGANLAGRVARQVGLR